MALNPDLASLKSAFRAGDRDKAIAAAEVLCLAHPGSVEVRQLCATMHIMTRNFARALPHLTEVCKREPANADAQFNKGLCLREVGDVEGACAQFALYTKTFPSHADGWANLAECLHVQGRSGEAADAYRQLLKLTPQDDAALKHATSLLLEMDRGDEAIDVCREVLKANPQSVTARLGAEWLLSQMVPLWHVPMMNEVERNQPYRDALQSVVKPDSLVFEIGTGSGLLAMMAAKAGARQVVTCEAVKLVANTAQKIVERNGLAGAVKVLAKPSYQVQVGADLPRQADILVHEIFSSELLGEHVLPAIEDAKSRLLKPGGKVLPGVASIMIALVGGEALGKELHVDEAFGFDLGPFNEIHPRKRPIHREDLPRVMLSADVEAFRFDFQTNSTFPPERKRIAITASEPGIAWGLVQWIRFEFAPGIEFENHPSRPRAVASWQQTIYRFAKPLEVKKGDVVKVDAMHDRSRPWFEQAAG